MKAFLVSALLLQAVHAQDDVPAASQVGQSVDANADNGSTLPTDVQSSDSALDSTITPAPGSSDFNSQRSFIDWPLDLAHLLPSIDLAHLIPPGTEDVVLATETATGGSKPTSTVPAGGVFGSPLLNWSSAVQALLSPTQSASPLGSYLGSLGALHLPLGPFSLFPFGPLSLPFPFSLASLAAVLPKYPFWPFAAVLPTSSPKTSPTTTARSTPAPILQPGPSFSIQGPFSDSAFPVPTAVRRDNVRRDNYERLSLNPLFPFGPFSLPFPFSLAYLAALYPTYPFWPFAGFLPTSSPTSSPTTTVAPTLEPGPSSSIQEPFSDSAFPAPTAVRRSDYDRLSLKKDQSPDAKARLDMINNQDPATDAMSVPVADPNIDPATDPAAQLANDPSIDPSTETAAQLATDPSIDPSIDPAAQVATDPSTETPPDPNNIAITSAPVDNPEVQDPNNNLDATANSNDPNTGLVGTTTGNDALPPTVSDPTIPPTNGDNSFVGPVFSNNNPLAAQLGNDNPNSPNPADFPGLQQPNGVSDPLASQLAGILPIGNQPLTPSSGSQGDDTTVYDGEDFGNGPQGQGKGHGKKPWGTHGNGKPHDSDEECPSHCLEDDSYHGDSAHREDASFPEIAEPGLKKYKKKKTPHRVAVSVDDNVVYDANFARDVTDGVPSSGGFTTFRWPSKSDDDKKDTGDEGKDDYKSEKGKKKKKKGKCPKHCKGKKGSKPYGTPSETSGDYPTYTGAYNPFAKEGGESHDEGGGFHSEGGESHNKDVSKPSNGTDSEPPSDTGSDASSETGGEHASETGSEHASETGSEHASETGSEHASETGSEAETPSAGEGAAAPAPTTLLTIFTKESSPTQNEENPAAPAPTGQAGLPAGDVSSGDTFTGSTLAGVCPNQCNPFNPAENFCDSQSTGCTTAGGSKYYCACRAGFKLSAAANKDFSQQFKVPGQPYVYTWPGAKCDKPCDDQLCNEVMVRSQCV